MRGSRYLALGAAGAVLQYAQTEHGLHLVPHCVRAEFVDLSEFARVDAGEERMAGIEAVSGSLASLECHGTCGCRRDGSWPGTRRPDVTRA